MGRLLAFGFYSVARGWGFSTRAAPHPSAATSPPSPVRAPCFSSASYLSAGGARLGLAGGGPAGIRTRVVPLMRRLFWPLNYRPVVVWSRLPPLPPHHAQGSVRSTCFHASAASADTASIRPIGAPSAPIIRRLLTTPALLSEMINCTVVLASVPLLLASYGAAGRLLRCGSGKCTGSVLGEKHFELNHYPGVLSATITGPPLAAPLVWMALQTMLLGLPACGSQRPQLEQPLDRVAMLLPDAVCRLAQLHGLFFSAHRFT